MKPIIKLITTTMKAICLTALAGVQQTNAQPYISDYKFNLYFEKAFELTLTDDWDQALPLFITLYQSDTENANLAFLIAFCLSKTRREPRLAIELFRQAGKSVNPHYNRGFSTERQAPISVFFHLGEQQFLEGDFQDALASYLKYLALLPVGQMMARNETQLMITAVQDAIRDSHSHPPNMALK